MSSVSFLHDYETPQMIELQPNFYLAQFRLMKLLPARYMLDREVHPEFGPRRAGIFRVYGSKRRGCR